MYFKRHDFRQQRQSVLLSLAKLMWCLANNFLLLQIRLFYFDPSSSASRPSEISLAVPKTTTLTDATEKAWKVCWLLTVACSFIRQFSFWTRNYLKDVEKVIWISRWRLVGVHECGDAVASGWDMLHWPHNVQLRCDVSWVWCFVLFTGNRIGE